MYQLQHGKDKAGDYVAQFIRRSLDRLPGVRVRYCITDGGTNLARALSTLSMDAVGDCTHVMMNAVKKLLADDPVLRQLSADIGTLRSYLAKHEELIDRHGRLLCCTDIIESTFGRYKNKGGTPTISADVLSIALYRVQLCPQFVRQALTEVPYQMVHACTPGKGST